MLKKARGRKPPKARASLAKTRFSMDCSRPTQSAFRKNRPIGPSRTGRGGPSQPANERALGSSGAKRGGTAGFGSSSHRNERNRSEESHFAGGIVLNSADDSARFSHDFDIFHELAEEVTRASNRDVESLRRAGFQVETPSRYVPHDARRGRVCKG